MVIENRLRPKYTVTRITPAGEESKSVQSTDPEDVDSPFVLMPRKDPAAFAALTMYAKLCEPRLANELRYWLRKIAVADSKLGTQGARNASANKIRLLDRST